MIEKERFTLFTPATVQVWHIYSGHLQRDSHVATSTRRLSYGLDGLRWAGLCLPRVRMCVNKTKI